MEGEAIYESMDGEGYVCECEECYTYMRVLGENDREEGK